MSVYISQSTHLCDMPLDERTEAMALRPRSLIAAVVGFLAVVVLSVNPVCASITYNIVDYPLDQVDVGNHTRHITSGSLITDDLGNFTGGNITIDGAYYCTINPASFIVSTGIYAPIKTATEISLPVGGLFSFSATDGSHPVGYTLARAGNPGTPFQGNEYYVTFSEPQPDGSGSYLDWWYTTSFATSAGHIAASDPWVIARSDVPEPASFIIFTVMGILFFGGMYLRRPRKT
jgi:hypothetical protein